MVVRVRIGSILLLFFLCTILYVLPVATSTDDALTVFSGSMTSFVEQPDWFSPVLVDVNGDGFLDVVKPVIIPPGPLGCLKAYDLVNRRTLWQINLTWCSPPALYDLDEDGIEEISVAGNGTEVWSIDSSSGRVEWILPLDDIFKFSQPVVYDVDADGSAEIIICGAYSAYVIDARNLYVDYVFGDVHMDFLSPVIGDINGDSIPEILLQTYDNGFSLEAISLNKTPYVLWRVENIVLRATPVLADINGDGLLEVTVPADTLRILDPESENLLYEVSVQASRAPSIGDIDKDGNPEIVVGCEKFVVAINHDGSQLWKTPLDYSSGYACSSPTLCDVDGDRDLDVVGSEMCIRDRIDGESGEILWTINNSRPILFSPLAADIDSDGYIEIFVYWAEKSLVETNGITTYWQGDSGDLYYWRTMNMFICDPDIDMLSSNTEKIIGTNVSNSDTDHDKLPDGWEFANHLDPLEPSDATLDYDDDGLNNTAEYLYGGYPWDNDTDNDGLSDYAEIHIGTDLRLNDTDGDGYSDYYEVLCGTDPLDPNDYPILCVRRHWWMLILVMIAIVAVILLYKYRSMAKQK